MSPFFLLDEPLLKISFQFRFNPCYVFRIYNAFPRRAAAACAYRLRQQCDMHRFHFAHRLRHRVRCAKLPQIFAPSPTISGGKYEKLYIMRNNRVQIGHELERNFSLRFHLFFIFYFFFVWVGRVGKIVTFFKNFFSFFYFLFCYFLLLW